MNKTIIVAGSGRSGTTWVQDAIAGANGFRTVFEPLHPVGVPWSQPFGYQYIRGGEENPALKAFMDKAVSGQMKSLWANYRIRPDRFSLINYRPQTVIHNVRKLIKHYPVYRPRTGASKGFVVKFIRANLMLGWLAHTYKHRILLVIRHPAAVVASCINLGTADWDADTALSRYVQNQDVLRTMQDDFGVDITKPITPAAAFACVWCIENLLPLRWAEQFGFSVTAYETLLSEPGTEWARIGKELELDQLPEQQVLASPSQQVARDMQGQTFGKSHLGKWRVSLNEEQLSDIQRVLDEFGVQIYNINENMPTYICKV